MCLAVALAFCSPWQGWPRGRAGRASHEDLALAGVRSRDWGLCPGSARGCAGTAPSAGEDGMWVWALECWELPVRALLTPTKAD